MVYALLLLTVAGIACDLRKRHWLQDAYDALSDQG